MWSSYCRISANDTFRQTCSRSSLLERVRSRERPILGSIVEKEYGEHSPIGPQMCLAFQKRREKSISAFLENSFPFSHLIRYFQHQWHSALIGKKKNCYVPMLRRQIGGHLLVFYTSGNIALTGGPGPLSPIPLIRIWNPQCSGF